MRSWLKELGVVMALIDEAVFIDGRFVRDGVGDVVRRSRVWVVAIVLCQCMEGYSV